jgi:hypothetical protein
VGPFLYWNALVNSSNIQINLTFTATNNGVGNPNFQPAAFTPGHPGYGFDNGGALIFDNLNFNTYRLNIHSITAVGTLGPKHFNQYDAFSILPTQSLLFQNSDYNPLNNNISESRRNTFYQDMNFEGKQNLPNNLIQIANSSAPKAQIPDSFYSQKSSIIPRYEGSKLSGNDYNIEGRNATIDRNPTYIAHFKSSYENLSFFGTTTFVIDQLIEIPMNEVLSEQSPLITSSLITGDNKNKWAVTSTFSPSRKATVLYNNPTKTFSKLNDKTLNYSEVKIGSTKILDGATDWKTYWTNQLSIGKMTLSQSLFAPSYTRRSYSTTTQFYPKNTSVSPNVPFEVGTKFFNIWDLSANLPPYQATTDVPTLVTDANGVTLPISMSNALAIFYTASSPYAESRGLGILDLRGLPVVDYPYKGNSAAGTVNTMYGPMLQIANSLNRCQLIYGDANPSSAQSSVNYSYGIPGFFEMINQGIISHGVPGSAKYSAFWGSQAVVANSMGLQTFASEAPLNTYTQIPHLNPRLAENFYRTDFSGSGLQEYEFIQDTKINIEPGDEIRVSYGYPTTEGSNIQEIVEQDFTVIDYELAPPAVQTDAFFWPPGGSTFQFTLSALITSSLPQYKNNPFQIDEYKRRLDIAIQNDICVYLASLKNCNSGDDPPPNDTHYMASGSGLQKVVYSNYVVNSQGENNPTKLTVTINRSQMRAPDDTTSQIWQFGTNNYGIIYKSFYKKNPSRLDSPLMTDGEMFPVTLNFDPGFLWDRLLVYPPPATLAKPIPAGAILSATFRKRVEDDSKIALVFSQPPGSKGIQTPSGDGYLIPNDLTDTQQKNVQKIINKLKSENVFTQDSSNKLD